jgi:DNA-binding NarL/FixJ family response regulator
VNAPPIGILLVDDHAIVREGYRALFARQPGLRVLAEAGDGATAYQLFKEQHPDVVITDISLPGSSGLELISRIKQRAPKARILVFSMHQNPGIALTAIRAGALGYVTKSSPPDVLLRAIADVQSGRHALSADIAQALAIEQLRGEQLALDSLTVREFEILMMRLDGRSTETIASALNISPKTVCNCHYLIKRKLGVGSDIELVRLAIRLNVMDLLQLSASP